MAQQAISYLLDVVFGLLTYAFLLRFVMQLMRAPFRNPLGQAVVALTDWLVKPLRRVLKGWKGIDWATLLATIVFQFLWILTTLLVFGGIKVAGTGILFVLVATLIALLKACLWLLIIDATVLWALVGMTWRSPRPWPVYACGFQMLALAGGVAGWVEPGLSVRLHLSFLALAGFGAVTTLALGAWLPPTPHRM